MKDAISGQERLVLAACELAAELPAATMHKVARIIGEAGGYAAAHKKLPQIAHAQFRARAGHFLDEWETHAPLMDAAAVTLALRTAAASEERHRHAQTVEAVWTGPGPEGSLRRTEQAILQLLDSAVARITLVSYAVYSIPNICDALLRAAARGVQITIIIETPDRLEGENTYSTLKALGSQVAAAASVYYWPAEKRKKSGSGKTGILHVKCAVADGHWLFLSSANLTSYAFDLNMELGLLVTGGTLPAQIENNFDRLIALEILYRI